MKISELSVNRPVTTVVIFLIIIVLGVYSLTKLAIDLIPDISYPIIAIFSNYKGVSPQEVEENLTRMIESSAAATSNVKKITSTSREGQSTVVIEYEWGTDMDESAADLREKLDLIRDYLPDDATQPAIYKFDPSTIPVMMITIEGDRDLKSLRYIADHDLKNNLEQIDGVANVAVFGGEERQVHVDLDRTLLASHNLSIDQVIAGIEAEHINIAGGTIDEGGLTYPLRTIGKFQSMQEIEDVVVANNNGVPVYLKDIADIYDGYAEYDMEVRIGWNDAIILVIYKQSGTNTVQIAKSIDKRVESLESFLPEDIKLVKFWDTSDYIKKSIGMVWQVALMGGVIAVFVLLVFLKNLPTTLVVSVSIPLSLITTFVFMYLFDLTLNMMSLGGLALGIGMLVDNSIVVLENIFRYREYGAKPMEASKLGAQEMSNAIIASTLTTIAAFLPLVFFIKGLASELFKDLAFTVTFSLISSLVVALTIIPMLTSKVRRVKLKGRADSLSNIEAELAVRGRTLRFMDRQYKRILDWALSHRWRVIFIISGIFVVSLVLISAVSVEFMPESDESFVQITLRTPLGSSFETTTNTVDKIYTIIEKGVPEVKQTFVQIGRSGEERGVESTDRAEIMMTLKDLNQRKRNDKQIIEDLRSHIQEIPAVNARFSTGGQSGGQGGNLSVIISGYDLKKGQILAEKFKAIMEGVGNIRDVRISREEGLPEYNVRVDRDRAAQYGISVAQVGQAIKRAFAGEEVSNVVLTGEEVDILVRLEEEDRSTSGDLELVTVTSPYGVHIPLSNLVKTSRGYGPVAIERERQQRVIYVNARVLGDVKGAVDAIKKEASKVVIPAGFGIKYGGSWERLQETVTDLGLVGLLAIIVVYLIMAALFESFADPFIIMFTLPLTFIGIVWMHIVTGTTFSAVSGIGVVMLLGIVVNNGIILVDYTNLLRKRGYDLIQAVVLAGRIRLRPILMTMSTTVLALLPMAFAVGSGSEMRTPMARTVIGGLLVSTLLTLVFIPVVYTMLNMRRYKREQKIENREKADE